MGRNARGGTKEKKRHLRLKGHNFMGKGEIDREEGFHDKAYLRKTGCRDG